MTLSLGSNITIYLLFGIGIAIIAAVWHMVISSLRYNQRERELQSLERIKAIECGYPLDQPKLMTAAISIGVAVPCSALACGFMATAMNAAQFAWPAVGVVGLAAVGAGTMLALKASNQSQYEAFRSKPAPGPESAELAGHRG